MNSPVEHEELLQAILRTDFPAFIHKVFSTLTPGVEFIGNWHIEAIAWQLACIENGDTKRLLITQPPRSLKSITTSIAWVAWCLGHAPSKTFICISYSQDLAADLSGKFRLVVESDWYKALFPNTRFTRLTESEARTSKGGGRITTSIGGTLTGRGADVIIIDDPLKAEDAASVTSRTRVIDWYQGTLLSRLNNQKQGAILIVMQRLHEEDLAGHVLLKDDSVDVALDVEIPERMSTGASIAWAHLDLPAIFVEDQKIQLAEDVYHYRKEQDVLHPAREGHKELLRLKKDLGTQRFSAQYQQRPIPLEGNLVKRDWFQTYTDAEIMILKGRDYARIVQSWDIAMSTTEVTDWSVCTTWLKHQHNHYLVDVTRVRRNYPELKRLIVTHAAKHGARTVLIEEAGLGKPLFQDLWAHPPAGFSKPIGIKGQGR